MTTAALCPVPSGRLPTPYYRPTKLGQTLLPTIGGNAALTNPENDLVLEFPLSNKLTDAWTPEDLKGYSENIICLSSNEIEDIEKALAHFNSTGLAIPHVSPQNFPLPKPLVAQLRNVSKIVHEGVGFATVRGLDPEKYSDEENTIIFCGLSSHVGCLRSTNKKGVSMSHLRDARKDRKPENRKDAELNASKLPQGMKFHADRFYGDVIAMYVKSDDAIGGEQYLANFAAIYNKLLGTSPQTLRILAKDWSWGKSKENETQPKSPVIFHTPSNRVIVQLIYRPFLDSGFSSAAEESALASVQACAQELCIKLSRQPGDLQFTNNLGLLHARDQYTDSSPKGRHMLRLGLRDPEYAWALPAKHKDLFDELFQTEPADQRILATDEDPWDLTTASINHHG